MNGELKPCPFCEGTAKIVVCDDEGNFKNEEYEQNPWSGICYRIVHYSNNCPVSTNGGIFLYETKEDARKAWNRRANECDRKALLGLADDIEGSLKDFGTKGVIAWVMTDIVNEIRKACGVVNETNN